MIKGFIFDMDGTVTVPYIDWKSLRASIDATPGMPILDYIESLPPERSAWANEILLQAEREAAVRADMNEGVRELLDYLESKGFRTALVTNNHRHAARIVVERYGLRFDAVLSREDGRIKPSADLIEKALAALGLSSEETIAVGDGRYDIEACRAAGVRCIYLTHGAPSFEHAPAVGSLKDVLALLETDGKAFAQV